MIILPPLQQAVIKLIEQFEIKKLCDEYFSDEFLWIVKGSSLLSKTYTDKGTYYQEALDRLRKVLLSGGTIEVTHTYFTQNTLILELQGKMRAKNGIQYNNEYCWIIQFKHDKIVSITAYLDTLLLDNILSANE